MPFLRFAWIASAALAGLVLLALPAAAVQHEVSIYLDLDDDASTGCDPDGGGGIRRGGAGSDLHGGDDVAAGVGDGHRRGDRELRRRGDGHVRRTGLLRRGLAGRYSNRYSTVVTTRTRLTSGEKGSRSSIEK